MCGAWPDVFYKDDGEASLFGISGVNADDLSTLFITAASLTLSCECVGYR